MGRWMSVLVPIVQALWPGVLDVCGADQLVQLVPSSAMFSVRWNNLDPMCCVQSRN